jgi:hypothetical protein
MSEDKVKALCDSTQKLLKEAAGKIEQFLNETTLVQLNPDQDPAMQEFYRDYLSDMRHLLVFCEVVYEKLGVALRRRKFNGEFAEKVLYEAYHECVNRYFFPKMECYSEDGRYAYTGQDAIRFRKKPVRAVRDLTLELMRIFEQLREDLAYYETDYVTHRRLQGEEIR